MSATSSTSSHGNREAEFEATPFEKKFAVLDAIPSEMCVIREDRVVVFVNKMLREKVGSIIGQKCYETVLASEDVCKNCPVTGGWDETVFPFTRRAKISSGQQVEIMVSRIVDEQTGRVYFVSTERDVTSEFEQERKIESLMSSLDHMPQAVAVVDMTGRGIYANRAFIRLMGVNEGKIDGFPMAEFASKSMQEGSMKEVIKEAMIRGWQGETSGVRPDGSKYFTFVEASPVRGHDGSTLGAVAIFRDVTKDRLERAEFEKYRMQLEERMDQRTNELARRVAQLTTINKISRVVTSILDPDQLMAEFVKSIGEGFQYGHVVIMLMDKEHGELHFKTGYGVEPETKVGEHRQKLKEGIIGHAAYFSETLVTGDVQSDPRYVGPRPLNTQSELAVPIVFRGELLGVLDIQAEHKDAFTRNDVTLIEMLADILATALTNARTYTESKEREYALSVIDRISKQVSFRMEPSVVLEQVAKDAASLLKAEKVVVWLKDERSSALNYVAGYNVDKKALEGSSFDSEQGVAGRALRRLKAEVVNDYANDPDCVESYMQLFKTRNMVCAPLLLEGRGIGVITAYNKLENGKFTKSDVTFLSSLADHAAIALENANLLASLNQRVHAQLALLETALSMQRQIDSGGIYESIAEKLREVTYYDAISFYRVDHERSMLVPILAKGTYADEVMADVFPMTEGITGYVARTGIAELVNDTLVDSRAVQVEGTPIEKEALMAIPLKGKERVIGVLALYRYGGGKVFTPSDFEVAQLFGSQAAVAIENSELYRMREVLLNESTKKIEQMAKVLELTTSAMYMDDLDLLLQRMADAVVSSFGFRRASISLLDSQKNVFVNRVLSGYPDWVVTGDAMPVDSVIDDMAERFKVGQSCYYVKFEDQKYGIEAFDFIAHPELATKPRDAPDAWHERDILMFALKSRAGALSGYLLVDEPNDRKVPQKDQFEVLEVLAGLASIAVENSKLYESQVFAVNEIALLNDLMTHDINNFNQGIMGYIELLLQDKGLDEVQRRYAEKALLQVRNNARLIDNIRKLSKVRAMSDKNFVPLDLYPPIAGAIEAVTKANPERNLVIGSVVLPNRYYIMGNQFISDLFLNVVSNAVKFDTSRRVKVDISVLEDVSPKGNYWLVSVVDRGRGIPDDRKKAVFERFATGITGVKGFGLGLSIVRTIVEKFGGRIWVEDRIQGDFTKGAVFKIQLPMAQPLADHAAASVPSADDDLDA